MSAPGTPAFGSLRIGYVPYSANLTHPADRRRFPYWARQRGVPFELAEPNGRYDLVVLSSTADITQWIPAAERGTPVVYELIDSYLAEPRHTLRSLMRGPAKFAARQTRSLALDYRRAMETMCRRSTAIVCSTPEQQRDLRALCRDVHVIVDCHVEVVRSVKSDYAPAEPFSLVWEGLPHTVDDFAVLAPVLAEISRARAVTLHLVTDLQFNAYAHRFGRRHTDDVVRRVLPGVTTVIHEWHEPTLSRLVTGCDLAVIPLELDDPFARAKPENKLLLLWRMGMPVVTSATPAYERVMGAAGLDSTCRTETDWRDRLTALMTATDARAHAGTTGRAWVEAIHSREAILNQWDDLVTSASSASARPGGAVGQ